MIGDKQCANYAQNYLTTSEQKFPKTIGDEPHKNKGRRKVQEPKISDNEKSPIKGAKKNQKKILISINRS